MRLTTCLRVFALGSALTLLAGASSGRPAGRTETAFFAGGCFWGVESVFDHVRGVKSAVSGFATPSPDSGAGVPPRLLTFAETVRVEFDPDKVTYDHLLEIFFRVAHDPSQVDRQGPDVGPQYRSIVFVTDVAQTERVQRYLAESAAGSELRGNMVTEVLRLQKFRPADDAHQDYVANHPGSAYVVAFDLPKLQHLRQQFPGFYH